MRASLDGSGLRVASLSESVHLLVSVDNLRSNHHRRYVSGSSVTRKLSSNPFCTALTPGKSRYRTSLTTPALSNIFENELLHALRRAFSVVRFLGPSVDDHGSLVIVRSASVRPIHLFDPQLQTMIIISNSLSRGSGMPIQVDGVLLHAMSGTELSRVRTEFDPL
jgi:hypothetical protein